MKVSCKLVKIRLQFSYKMQEKVEISLCFVPVSLLLKWDGPHPKGLFSAILHVAVNSQTVYNNETRLAETARKFNLSMQKQE